MKGKALYFVVLLVIVPILPVASEELDIDAMIAKHLQSVISDFNKEGLILTRTALIGSVADVNIAPQNSDYIQNADIFVKGLVVALVPPMSIVLIRGLRVGFEAAVYEKGLYEWYSVNEVFEFFLMSAELEQAPKAIEMIAQLSESDLTSVQIQLDELLLSLFSKDKEYPIRIWEFAMNSNQAAAFKELIEKGKDWLIDAESELIGEQE